MSRDQLSTRAFHSQQPRENAELRKLQDNKRETRAAETKTSGARRDSDELGKLRAKATNGQAISQASSPWLIWKAAKVSEVSDTRQEFVEQKAAEGLTANLQTAAQDLNKLDADRVTTRRDTAESLNLLAASTFKEPEELPQTSFYVVTWGNPKHGGKSSAVASELRSNVTKIFSNNRAFAALKTNGKVVTWGDPRSGGNSSVVASELRSNVANVFGNSNAFAALKTTGKVVTWGDPAFGGNSSAVASELRSNVIKIFSNGNAFVALKRCGKVVTWGLPRYGGNSSVVASELRSNVIKIFSNGNAFAALKRCGKVVTWGLPLNGGNSSAVASELRSKVIHIVGNDGAFAALKSSGKVVTWGHACYGGDSTAVATELCNVTKIFSTSMAFAALTASDQVVTWGDPRSGGNSSVVASELRSNVANIFGTSSAFAALNINGKVVTWGNPEFGGNSSAVASELRSNVIKIFNTKYAFAALKTDGKVVTWGKPRYGGNSSVVASELRSNVIKIFGNWYAFAALKRCGKVVTWGGPDSGGNSNSSLLQTRVKSIVTSAGAFAALVCIPSGMESNSYCEACGSADIWNFEDAKCLRCPAKQIPDSRGARCVVCPPREAFNSETLRCHACMVGFTGPFSCEFEFDILWRIAFLVAVVFVALEFFELCWLGISIEDVDDHGQFGVQVHTCKRLLLPNCIYGRTVHVYFRNTGNYKLDQRTGRCHRSLWRKSSEGTCRARYVGNNYFLLLSYADQEPLTTDTSRHCGTSKGTIHLTWGSSIAFVIFRLSVVSGGFLIFVNTERGAWYDHGCVIGACLGAASFATTLLLRSPPSITRKHNHFRRHLLNRHQSKACVNPGPERGLALQHILDVHDFYKQFIRDRSMYYVEPNIIRPLTQINQMSFAELVGPTIVRFFVSHYWGTAFAHFVRTLKLHAESVEADAPEHLAYWICSFSNNQWNIKADIPDGDWQQSSFYLALTSGTCESAVMVLDEQALPLTRSWCIFEVLQSFQLQQQSTFFTGLVYATDRGVLNEGKGSYDVAVALARRLVDLKVESATASVQRDKDMIDGLIAMCGGCRQINAYIKHNMRQALEVIAAQFVEDVRTLFLDLDSTDESTGGDDECDAPQKLEERTLPPHNGIEMKCL